MWGRTSAGSTAKPFSLNGWFFAHQSAADDGLRLAYTLVRGKSGALKSSAIEIQAGFFLGAQIRKQCGKEEYSGFIRKTSSNDFFAHDSKAHATMGRGTSTAKVN